VELECLHGTFLAESTGYDEGHFTRGLLGCQTQLIVCMYRHHALQDPSPHWLALPSSIERLASWTESKAPLSGPNVPSEHESQKSIAPSIFFDISISLFTMEIPPQICGHFAFVS